MKKTTKTAKNNLDERQEQALLRSESKGYWLAYWLLLIVIMAQMVLQPIGLLDEVPAMLPEWIVFMVLCAYMVVRCRRDNVWDRRLKPDFKTNLLLSLLAGAVVAVLCFLMIYLSQREVIGSLIAAAFGFVFTTVICLVIMSILAASYKKKRAALEQEETEAEDVE